MIDLESLGPVGNVCFAFGLVQFDDNFDILDRILYKASIASCISFGLKIDGKTLEWWLHPSRIALFQQLTDAGTSIKYVCSKLQMDFAHSVDIWAWNSDFDNAHVEYIFRLLGLEPKFSKVSRDARTIVKASKINPPRTKPHHPVEDCLEQVTALKLAYQAMNISL